MKNHNFPFETISNLIFSIEISCENIVVRKNYHKFGGKTRCAPMPVKKVVRKSTKAQKNVCEIWQLLFYALMKAVTAQRSIHSVPKA